jgi:threonyl-tRNA synthetase
LQKVPYMLIAGDRDIEAGAVSVRTRDNQDLGAIAVDDFVARLKAEAERR